MKFELKLFDDTLIKFSCDAQAADPAISILSVDESKIGLFPYGLEPSDKGVEAWLNGRVIPKNRAYMQTLLSRCGLAANRPMEVIAASMGLSLNDCYWVVQEGFDKTFDQCNLYENPISNILAQIVFTGHGSRVRSAFLSSPEFTTDGALAKCWRRRNGVISLWKSGTQGAVNTGNEPYSEFYAYQVAQALGFDAIPYSLSMWKSKKRLCSVCELFTSKDVSYVPMARLVRSGGIAAVEAFCEDLGPAFLRAFGDMLVFDAVVCNTDRHFGNFGVLVDSRSNRIIAPAPLYDHGNSLFPFAYGEDLEDEAAFDAYAKTLRPRTYDDFMEAAKSHLTAAHRDKLRGLFGFRFKKSRAVRNLPDSRLRLMEGQVQRRARALLG